jgi:uncharacterized protein YbjT (DUF2867 family)
MILVTGGTGNVGFELVKKLSEHGHPVRMFVRNRAHARLITPSGVEFAEGDFANPDTFSRALHGVDRLFLLVPSSSESERQQRSFVDAAKRSRVAHIVKLSKLGADEHSLNRFQRYHGVVESHVLKSGIPFTFIRPNLFMQSLLTFRPTVSSQGAMYASAGNARISIVDVRDVATIAAKALTESGHEGKTYNITGPEPLTHSEMARELSFASGKVIQYVDVPPGAMEESLVSFGMPAWRAAGVVEDYEHYRRGEAAMVTSTFREVTGATSSSFSQFAQDYAHRFAERSVGAA